MWCGLCGCECQKREGARSSITNLPDSSQPMGELLAELGHSVLEGALLCSSCVGLVRELHWFRSREADTRDKIKERALLKADNDSRREKAAEEAQVEPSVDGGTAGERRGLQPAAEGEDPPEIQSPADAPEDGAAATEGTTRHRRTSRRFTRNVAKKSDRIRQGDGEGGEGDPAAAVGGETGPTLGAGGDTVDTVSRVGPGVVKEGTADTAEPVIEDGDGDGDGVAANLSVWGPDMEQAAGAASGAASRGSARPDWNERWRSKTLKHTSWRDRRDGSGPFGLYRQAMLAAELPEQAGSLPGPAKRIKVEPGTEPADGACPSAAGPTPAPADGDVHGRPPTDNVFRVGRRVVTKQMDGSAKPAVQMMRKDRHGQPKVAFLDHKIALRKAARMDRIHEVLTEPLAARPTRPPRRRRVVTKPAAEDPALPESLLPSDVSWMAAGAPDDQTWLTCAAVGEGAVHAVLDVQPGEAWVDAIVRSEAAAASEQDAQAQMPVPLANIKSEPPE